YPYLTEGIGEDFVPANCDMTVVDKILKVSDKDAAIMARKAARLEGLFVGWSCGSALHGALEYAKDLTSKDVVVVLLPDHGSRYIGKIYNDTWMGDHGFLEAGSITTAQEILQVKGTNFIYLTPSESLADAARIMREQNISQLPVLSAEKEVIGSITETRILNALLDDPSARTHSVTSIMNDPFPFVLPTTRIDALSKMLNKENSAVLVKLSDGQLGIITKSDLINVLAN
ncbi:MAG: CBS domain-containing protein, partial [Bacteroidia bacterium]|nr:CBS domain-containing protein [Bacteroidia bacterium]